MVATSAETAYVEETGGGEVSVGKEETVMVEATTAPTESGLCFVRW